MEVAIPLYRTSVKKRSLTGCKETTGNIFIGQDNVVTYCKF